MTDRAAARAGRVAVVAVAAAVLSAVALGAGTEAAAGPATAASPDAAAACHLDGAAASVAIVHCAEMFEDTTGQLEEGDVLDPARAGGAFRPLAGRERQGYRRSAFWLRFRLLNRTPDRHLILELTNTPDVAALFRVDAGGATTPLGRSGTSLPFTARPIAARRIALPFEAPPGAVTEYLLRLASSDTLVIDPHVYTPAAFAAADSERTLGLGVYVGWLTAIVLYNAFLFVSTRERVFGLYVLFQALVLLSQVAGDKLAFQYLWPHHPVWALRSEQVFVALGAGGALAFGIEFLDLERRARRWFVALRAIALGALAFAGVACLVASEGFFAALSGYVGGTVVLLAVAAGLALRAGAPNATVFLVAWLPFLGVCGAIALAGAGWAQLGGALPLVKVASAFEATVLALGLALRIKRLRREQERAQSRLLEVETAHARELEARVVARTAELADALGQLRATQRRLVQQERISALAGLMAGVTHEIGNPLNFTLGGAAELEVRLTLADAQARTGAGLTGTLAAARRALGLVRAGAERIKVIVDSVRSYSRMQAAETVADDVVAAVDRSLELAADMLGRGGVRVERRGAASLPPVQARPGELEQIFTNLVVNAGQAMSGGGTLVVEAARSGDALEIKFQDTGPGVPAQLRACLFEPFFTGRGEAGGSGLGLYISRELASRHGGTLTLEPSERGACFVVRLPAPEAAAR